MSDLAQSAERTDLDSLARRTGAGLRQCGLLLATAESCTGGLVAAAITAIAGSSAWFDCGFVTYSNAAKERMLGVPSALLVRHGAVSEPVARAMAEGAVRQSAAQVGLSITGIAGPDGGTPDKPVGMVCFGWHGPQGTRHETRRFEGDREAVRQQAAAHALRGTLDLLARLKPSESAGGAAEAD